MATAVAERKKEQPPLLVLKAQIDQRETEFARALPAHIPVERFMRVIMTAAQNEPDLLTADRQSFMTACMRAAQDGLLPDKRDGAIVTFNTKVKREGKEVWVKMAQWMPMIFGILKKVRNSGKLATITARVVYGGDHFRYWVDDDGEHVDFEPSDAPDKSIVRRVFAMAKTTDGELYVEPLTADDIEKIRSVSRAKDKGPWVEWWEEMAKKSALRRLAKRLPTSSDLDDLLRRDDELYDLKSVSDRQLKPTCRQRLSSALDALAQPLPAQSGAATAYIADAAALQESGDQGEASSVVGDLGRGETRQADQVATNGIADAERRQRSRDIVEGQGDIGFAKAAKEDSSSAVSSGEAERTQSDVDLAFDRGWRDRSRGLSRRAVPGELREEGRQAEAKAWLKGFDEAGKLDAEERQA